MKRRRISVAAALGKGLFTAVAVTLLGMLAMAGAVILFGMSDAAIRALNQALKAVSVALGAFVAVKRGGERGLVTGAGIGAMYAVAGYMLYALLGNGAFDIVELLGEMTICTAAGALAGVVCANLSPARKAVRER